MNFLSNSLIYIAFGILLQFLVEVSNNNFKPRFTYSTATFINNKLYILGGAIPSVDTKSPKETFLYLDFSAPFTTNGLEWFDLSTNNNIPPHRFASAVKGGENNSTLFLYGGGILNNQLNDESMELLYAFNTQNNLWSVPKTTGVQPRNNNCN
jgi:hypothetical protein